MWFRKQPQAKALLLTFQEIAVKLLCCGLTPKDAIESCVFLACESDVFMPTCSAANITLVVIEERT